jgi:hypothetical protein
LRRRVVIVLTALLLFTIHEGEMDSFSLDRSRDVVKVFEVFGELLRAEAQSMIVLYLHIMSIYSRTQLCSP